MKTKKTLLFIAIFLLIGEILIRVDKKHDILNEKSEIEIKIEASKLKNSVDNNNFKLKENQYRVMVLGDSYFYGAGIKSSDKFSEKLKIDLQNTYKNKEILILDLSRPSNNTLDNYNLFNYYKEIFKPNIVILGYNFNDILGDLNLPKNSINNDNSLENTKDLITVKKDNNLKSLTKKIYNTSELLRFSSTKIQKELKLNGILLPFGEFYFLAEKAYNPENEKWKSSIKVFKKFEEDCINGEINFVFYKLPEFNLIRNNFLFKKGDTALISYFKNSKSTTYIDGFYNFDLDNKYMISKYDGHPNKEAHKIISQSIVKEIIDENLFHTFD